MVRLSPKATKPRAAASRGSAVSRFRCRLGSAIGDVEAGLSRLPFRIIQDWLGHRDSKHTSWYTRVADRRFEGVWD